MGDELGASVVGLPVGDGVVGRGVGFGVTGVHGSPGPKQ